MFSKRKAKTSTDDPESRRIAELEAALRAATAERDAATARADAATNERDAAAARADAAAARADALREERATLLVPLGEALQSALFSTESGVGFFVASANESSRTSGLTSLGKEDSVVYKIIMPAHVRSWDSFDDDMKLSEHAVAEKPEVIREVFGPIEPPTESEQAGFLKSEADLSAVFRDRVFNPLAHRSVLGGMEIRQERTDTRGMRADYDIAVPRDTTNAGVFRLGKIIAAAVSRSSNKKEKIEKVVVLRHEHKAADLFPLNPEKVPDGALRRIDDLPTYWDKMWKYAGKTLDADWVDNHPSWAYDRMDEMRQSGSEPKEDDLGAEITPDEALANAVADFAYPICQIFTYMVTKKLRYGALSTTMNTWFMKWDKTGVLYISSVRKAEGFGRESVKLAYYSLLKHLTMNQHDAFLEDVDETTTWYNSEMKPRMPDKAAPGGASGGERKVRMYREPGERSGWKGDNIKGKRFPAARRSLALPALDLNAPETEVYTDGPVARVSRRFAHGEDLVVKAKVQYFDDWKQDLADAAERCFEREMDALERLADLEGTYIPRVMHMGPYGVADLIVTRYEGPTLLDAFDTTTTEKGKVQLPEWAADGAREALRAVHDRGVLHRDVALRNFVVDKERKSVKIIDFGAAEIAQSVAKGDDPARRREEAKLERLLAQGYDDWL